MLSRAPRWSSTPGCSALTKPSMRSGALAASDHSASRAVRPASGSAWTHLRNGLW